MNSEKLTSMIAPCGLDCSKCLAFEEGDIRKNASELKKLLGKNFSGYASRFAGMNPAFEGYAEFARLLEYLATGPCGGCRKESCLFGECRVRDCVREKGVDYCCECPQFPCEEHGLPEGLRQRWEANNLRIAEAGLVHYYEEVKSRPRYP
ncbi:MAG: DUF3795 domain-containing protein [Thermovirgaceae bacterium]|nr:DUF3795 domain-containing protein [Synergistales bacterium]